MKFARLILPSIFAIAIFSNAHAANFSEKSFYGPTSAPFTALEVLEHARTSPRTYDMEYLETTEGQNAIVKVLESIKATGFPPQEYGTNTAWNRGNVKSSYNMSLVADYVCRAFAEKRESSK